MLITTAHKLSEATIIIEILLLIDCRKYCNTSKYAKQCGGHSGILGDMEGFVKHHFRYISLFSP